MRELSVKELKIGNIVSHQDYGGLFVVDTIEKNEDGEYIIVTLGGKNETWVNSIHLIEPVPITKGLLLYIGFIKATNKLADDKLVYEISQGQGNILQLNSHSGSIWDVYTNWNGRMNYITATGAAPVYMHQLQNLYYEINHRDLIETETLKMLTKIKLELELEQ